MKFTGPVAYCSSWFLVALMIDVKVSQFTALYGYHLRSNQHLYAYLGRFYGDRKKQMILGRGYQRQAPKAKPHIIAATAICAERLGEHERITNFPEATRLSDVTVLHQRRWAILFGPTRRNAKCAPAWNKGGSILPQMPGRSKNLATDDGSFIV